MPVLQPHPRQPYGQCGLPGGADAVRHAGPSHRKWLQHAADQPQLDSINAQHPPGPGADGHGTDRTRDLRGECRGLHVTHQLGEEWIGI